MPPTAGSSTAERWPGRPSSRFYYDFASPEAYLVAERARTRSARCPSGCRCGCPACAPASSALPLRGRGRRLPRGHRAPRAARGLKPLRWPDPFPADADVGDARRRPTRSRSAAAWRSRWPRSARRSPPAATWRARQRADRRRGVRDAPGRGRQGRRAATRSAAGSTRRPTRAARRGVLEVPAVRIGDRCSTATASSSSPRRRWHEGQPRLRAARATAAAGRRLLPQPARIEQVEVVEIDTGEVVLFWDTRPRQTRAARPRAARRPRALEADEFLAKWRR